MILMNHVSKDQVSKRRTNFQRDPKELTSYATPSRLNNVSEPSFPLLQRDVTQEESVQAAVTTRLACPWPSPQVTR